MTIHDSESEPETEDDEDDDDNNDFDDYGDAFDEPEPSTYGRRHQNCLSMGFHRAF